MSKITPCLWYGDKAEEAANFYVSLVPDSHIDKVNRSASDTPGGKAGSVMMVSFTLAGQRFLALNGGQSAEYTHAVSFHIECVDQAEVDRLWDGLCADGGAPVRCGWLKDRYGLSWQIVPAILPKLLGDADTTKSRRAMAAMLKMVKLDIAALQAAFDGKEAA